MIISVLYRTDTGFIQACGPLALRVPEISKGVYDPNIALLECDVDHPPDPAVTKVDVQMCVFIPKTTQDLAADEEAKRKPRATRDLIMTKFTGAEWVTVKAVVAHADADTQRDFDAWLSDPVTDLNSTTWRARRDALAPLIWPDAAVRDARIAAIEA